MSKRGKINLNKKKIIFSILTFIFPIFVFTGSVMAGNNDSTITYEQINNAYFYVQNKITGEVDTNHVTKFYLNGRIAYCIEPMVDINGKIYNSTTDWNITNLSSEVRRYIERIGYYGYEYPGHETDKYWLATQALIWEKVNSNVSVKFTTGPNGSGNIIDLTSEKNEILKLAEKYSQTASFAQEEVEGNIGDEIILTDENNVLSEFSMEYNGDHQITKSGNKLIIKLSETSIGEDSITFRKDSYDNQVSVIYYQGDSQKLASLRISDPTTFTLKIKSNGASIELNKKGEKLIFEDGSYKYQTIKLPNVVYALYANEDIKNSSGEIIYKKYELIDTLTTDDLGYAVLDNLYFGKYFLVEGESSLGNMINNERIYFEISKNDIINGKITKVFDFQNYLPKGTLNFLKVDSVDGTPIANTEIMIFTENDQLVYQGKTDENGRIVINDLPLGKYYVIERNPSDGYKLTDTKMYFEISENGATVDVTMTNDRIVKIPDTLSNDFGNILGYGLITGGGIVLLVIVMALLINDKRNKQ